MKVDVIFTTVLDSGVVVYLHGVCDRSRFMTNSGDWSSRAGCPLENDVLALVLS